MVFYLGFALAVAPDLWKGLSEKERANVENWLGNSINEKKSVSDNRNSLLHKCQRFGLTNRVMQHAQHELALVPCLCQSWSQAERSQILGRTPRKRY